MSLIIIVGCIWGICKLISAASAASKERARQAQLERIRREQERVKLEQARQREAWKAAQAAERERVRQMVALEREQIRQQKLWEKQQKEDAARDAKIAKLEEAQRKMQFELDQIKEDLPLLHRQLDVFMGQMDEWQNRLHKAQLDLEWDELRMREAPSAVNGKEHDAHLKAKATAEGKIISLEKNIRKVEKQISTAEFKRGEYERKLSA